MINFLKFSLFVLALFSVTNCSFVIKDPRPPAVATATNEAKANLVPTVTMEPQVVPEEEEGVTEPEPPSQPPCLDIKGNISSSGDKIFHVPDGQYYDRVKIDEGAGEKFFCTEEEAIAAGWRKSTR